MAKQTFVTGDVLTAAAMTSLQQTAMGGGSTTAKTSSYVLVAADAGTVVQMNAAGATTITVNTALFSAGDSVQIQNIGAGTCTITAGTATVNTAGSLALGQYEGGQLYFNTTSAALFFDTVQTSSTPTYVGCALNISTSTQSIATNTGTSILFDTEVIDTDGFHSNVTNTDRITIPAGKAGKYLVTAAITMAANSTGARVVNIAKNGSTAYGMTFPATATGASFGYITYIVDLAVSDYITASMFHTAGTNLNVQGVNTVGAGGTALQATFIGV